MYKIDIVTLFLMLASEMMSTMEGIPEASMAKSLSCWIYLLRFLSLHFEKVWKEKQLAKMSIILFPEENSGFKGSNKGNTSLN